MDTGKWQELRYRGDLEDVKELLEVYRVGNYLEAFEENQRHREEGMRDRFLAQGIKLTERLSPRIHRVFGALCRTLDLQAELEVFCLPELGVNAMAAIDFRDGVAKSVIGVTAGALERLEDAELASILGHEVGHFLFGNNRFNALICFEEKNPAATVLPPLGESLFLRWRKKAEISADRVGLLAAGDLNAAGRALLKAAIGLSDRNLNLDVEALLVQIEELKGSPELVEATFSSHPLLPVRLKALDLFSRSAKARRFGFPAPEPGLSDDELADGIDQLMRLTRKHPTKPIDLAVMRVIALAGIEVLGADRDVRDEELRILIEVLHTQFTDEPENEIVTEPDERARRLAEAIQAVRTEGDDRHKTFIVSRLADIALADGALMTQEGSAILKIAEDLGMPSRTAYQIMVGAAQSVGFKVDVKLNRVADALRKSLGVGFAPGA